MRYVNVYEIHKIFGGPEEGGWYYNSYSPMASVPFSDETPHEVLEAERLRLIKLYRVSPKNAWVEDQCARESSESHIYS
jgi:hypothetical protein